jgi:2'-5' RNA ligase
MFNYKAFKKLTRVLAEKAPEPTYVAVKPDQESKETLVELAEAIGLSSQDMVPENELHATVTYSREPIADPTEIIRGFMPIEAMGDEFHFFRSKDGKDCLVLKLSSVGLRALHSAIKTTGASHDFPTFEAHVTLCYDTPKELKEQIESYQSYEPKVPVNFVEFEVKPLDPE